MGNRLKNKIRSRCGETLIEVLSATLIVSLASAMFLTMVMTATNINRNAQIAGEKFYNEMSLVEVYEISGDSMDESEKVQKKTDATVKVKIESTTMNQPVNIFYGSQLAAYCP